MKILFLTHPYPNYVPDLLLHGLRKLFGPEVVDYPRKNCLYEGVLGLGVCPEDQRCPGWFPQDSPVCDRTDIWQKVKRDFFDLVICDIRALPMLTQCMQQWPNKCVLIDGEDKPHHLLPGPYILCRRETDGSDYSIPLPMALPEEVFHWISSYDRLPKSYSIGFLGSTHDGQRRRLVESLADQYPDALFAATPIPSQSAPVPGGRLGRDGYYRKLQQCRMVLTLAGAGFDTFRFWENAACNALHLAGRFPFFIPNDFENGVEIMRFNTVDGLKQLIDGVMDREQAMGKITRQGRQKLLGAHLTTHRAKYLLDRVQAVFAG